MFIILFNNFLTKFNNVVYIKTPQLIFYGILIESKLGFFT